MQQNDLTSMPAQRPAGCPFDPPAELAGIRDQHPVARMTYPDGHRGWLVTGHAQARAVLGDSRFTSRYERMHYPFPGLTGEIPPAPPGDLAGMDAPEHTRFRRLLAGKFTVRRMRQLTARTEEVAAEHLDAMERRGPDVDLVEAFAFPVPAVMICELLGVPYADREFFKSQVAVLTGQGAAPEEQFAAYAAVQDYLRDLVRAKRAEPTDDVLGDLTGSDLTDEELSGVGTFLLGAGLDTTATMLALGTFALLSHPAQLAALRDDPGLADSAVEELLRYLTIAHTAVRAALEDVEVDGQVIKAGESVAVALQAANRDPARFPAPDDLDVHRRAAGQLAFGHGIHQCLGQQLARVEMRVAFPALLTRFPTLRLAVPPEEVPLRHGTSIHGVRSLPVTWDV